MSFRDAPSSLAAPTINPRSAEAPRPTWSVMIPTYNPQPDYLTETLRSVLQQAPDASEMQIEIIDDCSPLGSPADFVREIARDRVQVHREPQNLGLAAVWNRCIERAQGQFVHILHQDDVVYPGFYDALRRGFDCDPGIGAAFCRFAYLDPSGHPRHLSKLHSERPTVLPNWDETIASSQLIQCPSIAVRRAVYEHLGGFLPSLKYALDWEMWQRIALHYRVWFEPGLLAGYREHPVSTSTRMQHQAADIRDVREMLRITEAYQVPRRSKKWARIRRKNCARRAMAVARTVLVAQDAPGALRQIGEAVSLSPSLPVFFDFCSFVFLWCRLIASRIKRRFLNLVL